MTGLLRAELLRLTSRRLARVFGLVALGLVVLVQLRLLAVSHPPSANPFEPVATLYARDALGGGAYAVAVGCAIFAFVVGAAFVGAEWHNGTMQALLFWEPRRPRVLLAKMIALVAVVVAFVLALEAFTFATTYLVAAARGSTEGVTGGIVVSTLLTVLRGCLLASITALFGFGVAGLCRITGAALGAGFGYFVIGENVLMLIRPGWHRYTLQSNLTALMAKHADVVPASGAKGLAESGATIGGVRGAVTLLLYLALVLGAFAVTFTRRDVT